MRRTNDLGKDPVFPLVCRLAIPTMLAQMVSVLYSIVDRMYIGNIPEIGDLALAGVGVCGPIVTLLGSFATLVGLGGSPILAMRMGEGNEKEARKVLSNSFLMLLVLSGVLTTLFLLLKGYLLMWFGASPATFGYANTYLTIYTAGTFFALMATGMNSFLIAQGFSGLGMATVMLGAVLNIALDPVFIFVFRLEIAGAAMATALSNLVAFGYFVVIIARRRGETVITASPSLFIFAQGIPREVCTVGLASALMNLLGITSNTVLNNLMSSYSDAALAGMGIAKKIDMLTFAMSIGMTQGVISLIGYNYSSKNYRRMLSAIKTVFVNAMVVAVVTTLFLFFCAAPVSRFFIEDAETVTYGHRFLRILCIICPMQAISMTVITVFQAIGQKTRPMVLSLLRKGIVDIPIMFLLDRLIGVTGIA